MKTVPVETETVDATTGETVNREMLQFTLAPPRPGLCAVCAVDHLAEQPHNAQSLYYQYQFYGEHGRWPTWADALAHCSSEMREAWEKELVIRKAFTKPDGAPIAQPYSVQE